MTALQGTFTHPTTQQQTPNAYLVLDDVVVSLQSQVAAIHWSVYSSEAAYAALVNNTAIVTPVYQDHDEAQSPQFAQLTLAAIPAGTLDSQIRNAAFQWLLSRPEFSGWAIVA